MSPHFFPRALLVWAVLALAALTAVADPDPSPPTNLTREQSIAADLLEQINSYRAGVGMPPLRLSSALTRAAEVQSQDMARLNFFDHRSPVAGRTRPADRATGAGYTSRIIAENLFMVMGVADDQVASQCLRAWTRSPGHCRNMTDSSRPEVGIGVATNNADEIYVTAVFGHP